MPFKFFFEMEITLGWSAWYISALWPNMKYLNHWTIARSFNLTYTRLVDLDIKCLRNFHR